METYSLLELNEHVRRVIALNFDTPIWVRCEISQAKQSRGHLYLDLVEKSEYSEEIKAQSNAALWSSKFKTIVKKHGAIAHQILANGVEACLLVKVEFHERYGLKLVVEDIDPSFTIGNIELRRREILEDLAARSLIGKNALLDLPLVPQRVAVLSNETAAGYQDFANHLMTNAYTYHFDTHLYTVALQGGNVENDVCTALKSISNASTHYDCVVIIRGGGSRIDLSGFDSLRIGEAIANCPLPVITGIGHEIDESVADAVAHTALKTPTAAAEFIIDLTAQFENEIELTYRDIIDTTRTIVTNVDLKLRDATSKLSYLPRQYIGTQHIKLDDFMPQMGHYALAMIRNMDRSLASAKDMVNALDPVNVVKRGYSVTRVKGRVVTLATQLSKGDTIETEFKDGTIESTVN